MLRTIFTSRAAVASIIPKAHTSYISLSRPLRQFSTSGMSASGLRIGFVPEHFSTPLEFAKKHYGLSAKLLPYPAGTGHMVTALQSGDIDIGVGLTEGWIAALGKAQAAQKDAGFRVVGTYVETPLCWAISTGAQRDDINNISDLKGKTVGVSRIGSGSYVMSYVLADQQGWLDTTTKVETPPPFPIEPLETFARLRDGVNDKTADFFMWEHFTSKRYYDNGSIKRVGEIYTPWSSWKIVAANTLINPTSRASGPNAASSPALKEELQDALQKINKGVRHFEENKEEAVTYISTKLDYSDEDAREWLKTVRFAHDVRGVDRSIVSKTVGILQKAGVLGEAVDEKAMIGLERSEAMKWI
ncbi:ABC-type nitrate/sulfonate/bicarbonate transport system periplasmic component-like protein [Pleomassaria siparia CBS 279.74]|uniref:ABC-type nitrate/sulfonate/bicarbonate transport system periplasmic component-like protein n=1 Tax=Pleomassaria siparia CBS 279.74 TaxID=1314801 RepID=A0A6G1K072_9PLEO|nr:ABC-type nitrate/sulfonate/bicarbonate transport system periplasmic component-like protein [Pleomassaria siparia CBS 279.74]